MYRAVVTRVVVGHGCSVKAVVVVADGLIDTITTTRLVNHDSSGDEICGGCPPDPDAITPKGSPTLVDISG